MWTCDRIILCIRGIALLDDVINVFMLDFLSLNWRKIHFECPTIIPRLKIEPYSSIFSQYTWFSGQVLTCNSIHKQYDGKTWKTVFRWYRTHIRSVFIVFVTPSLILEDLLHCLNCHGFKELN